MLQEASVLPQLLRPGMAAGASSFGMSGVNAHGLITAPAVLTHESRAIAWQRARHWMLPLPHHLLNAAAYVRANGMCRCASGVIVTCLTAIPLTACVIAGMLQICRLKAGVHAPAVRESKGFL